MEKQAIATALAAVVVEAAPWHSSSGYFCDRCGVECGTDVTTVCSCCADALQIKTGPEIDFDLGGEG